ncbi:hypothetical protein CYJ66_00320 [Gardnerella vaginalis]|nr:hypothetical protein EGX90_02640 [Gardnerella vaginalis]PKZ45898.1 hypothetical protein CYJ68_02430 [Gardnerella vaginalis]PKZ53262.1 hypothetical protein CYJ66_00320 [Gardnerella vaginalis]PKZ55370.1 hypothetical protein CYJ64_00320 [Gardnerella vaginalis]PNL25595.1 hypothetical protein CEP75_002625 [Gardnerella vaginalis]
MPLCRDDFGNKSKNGKESVKPRKPCRVKNAFATSALANCTSNQPPALTKEPRTT